MVADMRESCMADIHTLINSTIELDERRNNQLFPLHEVGCFGKEHCLSSQQPLPTRMTMVHILTDLSIRWGLLTL